MTLFLNNIVNDNGYTYERIYTTTNTNQDGILDTYESV